MPEGKGGDPDNGKSSFLGGLNVCPPSVASFSL